MRCRKSLGAWLHRTTCPTLAGQIQRSSIVVIVVGAKSPGLRIDGKSAGLSVLRPLRFKIPALTHDLDVGVALRLQFLSNLVLGHGLIPGDENRTSALLGRRNQPSRYSNKQKTTEGPHEKSKIHGTWNGQGHRDTRRFRQLI